MAESPPNLQYERRALINNVSTCLTVIVITIEKGVPARTAGFSRWWPHLTFQQHSSEELLGP